MSSAEFAEEQAAWEIEPWGELSGNWQLAVIGSMLINSWRDRSHVKPKDLMPGRREDEPQGQSVEVQKAICRQIATAVGNKKRGL